MKLNNYTLTIGLTAIFIVFLSIILSASMTHMVMLMLSVKITIWTNTAKYLLKHMIWLRNMTRTMVRLCLLGNYVLTC